MCYAILPIVDFSEDWSDLADKKSKKSTWFSSLDCLTDIFHAYATVFKQSSLKSTFCIFA